MSTGRRLRVATDATPERDRHRAPDGDRQRADLQPDALALQPDRGRQRERVEACISPTHTVSRPARSAASAISTASSSGRSSQNGIATPTPLLMVVFKVG